MIYLNVCGGKILPLEFDKTKDIVVNVDKRYFNEIRISDLENIHKHKFYTDYGNYEHTFYCNHDIYEFINNYVYTFDRIAMYRFLEHVPKDTVLYFIYLLSTVAKIGGTVDVIVPDCELLAKRILEEDVNAPNFEAEDIITTYELLNEAASPHVSLWSEQRAKYFFELEGRFKITKVEKSFDFDGRDIYLRFEAVRIK